MCEYKLIKDKHDIFKNLCFNLMGLKFTHHILTNCLQGTIKDMSLLILSSLSYMCTVCINNSKTEIHYF